MSAKLLLEHFDRLAEAPDAIPRLRQFILDLALRGKLVEQDPMASSADGMLAVLGRTRDHFVSTGRLKTVGPAERLVGDMPFELPHGWCWASPDQLSALVSHALTIGPFGSSLLKSDYRTEGVPLVFVGDVTAEFSRPIARFVTDRKAHELRAHTVKTGDLVITKMGDPPGHTAIYPAARGDGIVTADCIKWTLANEVVNTRYLYFAIRARVLADQIVDITKGAAHQKVSLRRFRGIRIPLPPLAEQHHIVAKVDELMALCDRLEAAQAEREHRRDRLVAASLHRLNTATDRDAFRAAAVSHLSSFSRSVSGSRAIQLLLRTIQDVAVQGKLVTQLEADGTGSDLLRSIRRDRSRERKLARNASPTADAKHPDSPLPPIPRNWVWTTLGELTEDSDSGWSPKTESYPRSGEAWGVLKVSAVSWDEFRTHENKQLLPGNAPPIAAQVHIGDFLMSRANTSELVAKCVIVDREPERLILSDKIVRLRLTSQVDPAFVALVNNHARYARDYFARHASGTSLSMKNVSRPVIYELPIPLPPLSEQRRIVAKINEVKAVCDCLDSQTKAAHVNSQRMLDEVLREALG